MITEIFFFIVDCDAQLKIEMATRMFLILWLLCVGLVVAEDVDFGDPNTCVLDSNKICEKNLQIDCQGELSGFIISPNFPANMLEEHSGKYHLTISSCENSQISLILTDEDFFLGPSTNKFSVGNGLVVGSSTIPPELKSLGDSGNELPDGASTYPFESSSNTMWMEADMNAYRSNFKIQYIVTLLISNIHNYNEKSGNMTSPGYGTSYPIEATEDVHVIDVTAVAGEYVDLLLTVNVLDIKGIYGDYIKIGPGSDPEVQKSAVVLSWRVNKGVQFLIDGPKAHLVFNVVKPFDAEQPSANGFFISYQAIEKNLTTTAPSTSPMPTSPTPLPFDPDILLTDIVYQKYVGAKASSQLAEILQKYAESSGMLEKGQITPGLTENGTVQIVQVENCYHGWNVDRDTCGLTQSIVRAFYQETGQDNVYVYAFPTEEVKKAVREYGSIHEIVLPEDLVNLYWISVGVILILIILILLGLLIAWRQKMRRDASKRRKYHEIKSNKLSSSVESDISIKGVGTSNHFDMNSGVDNPNFIIDEPEYGRPVMVYDPEKGTFYSRGNQKSTYQAKDLDVGPIRSAAVLNVSPITTNFQRHNGNKRDQMVNDGNDMSSIMPPLSAVPKRGILKQNSNSPTAREFPNIASIPMEEIEDVIFDNHTLKDMQQRRYSPASSSSDTIVSSSKSSRNNSISTDQPIGSHVLYGVTLEGFESDEENETNF